jgi:hypothetical protein
MELAPELRQKLLTYQKVEITEHHIYQRLAQTTKSPENRRVLETISLDELRHCEDWKKHTGQDVSPDRFTVLVISSGSSWGSMCDELPALRGMIG